MRAKKGFINRKVCGESVLLAAGQENIDFTNIISLNETADFLWKKIAELPAFTVEDLVGFLTSEYEVSVEDATADCRELVQKWTDAGILEGDDLPPVSQKETEADPVSPANDGEQLEEKPKKGFFGKLFNW